MPGSTLSWHPRSRTLSLQETAVVVPLENYSRWLEEGDMSRYIFVDYRATRPVHSHPCKIIRWFSCANELTHLFATRYSAYTMSFLTTRSINMLSSKEAIYHLSLMVICRRCKASDPPFVSKVPIYSEFFLLYRWCIDHARRLYKIQLVLHCCCHSKGNRYMDFKHRSAKNGRTTTDAFVISDVRPRTYWTATYHLAAHLYHESLQSDDQWRAG